MSTLKTTDNNCGKLFLTKGQHHHIANLKSIANTKIKDLVANNTNLLVFPQSLKSNDDDIGENSIFDLHDNQLTTNNIMGFIGINDTQLNIQSRFTTAYDDDYFLHYMLQKVLCINLFDLKHSKSKYSVFDFLVYLFPYFLKKALAQGLYKQYHKKEYNNANIKGAIDINTHIKKNVPFRGNVAYRIREHSFDNHITQLVRHTIEFIKQTKGMIEIFHADSDTHNYVKQIIQYTPTYDARDRYSVINQNIKAFSHPYFHEYASLQTICMQILRYEGLRYANNDDKAHGILFDGAWLWEEYLNTLLQDIGFKHPQNKTGKAGIKVYAEKVTGNNVSRYPDFVRDNIILDAKYKRMTNNSVSRDDLNQVISYLYLYKSEHGGFIAPMEENNEFINLGVLNGYGGSIYKCKLGIPQHVYNYPNFCEKIKINENTLTDAIDKFTN